MRTNIKGSIVKRGTSFRAFYCRAGKRITATFPTRQLANSWLIDQNQDLESLTGAELKDACEARRLLRDGVTLTDCVEYYNLHHVPDCAYTLEALANAFIADRETALRPATIRNYRLVLNQALSAFTALPQLTTEAIRNWVNTMTPHNKNRAIRALSAFFGWCIEHGYARTNPVATIKLARTDAPTRAVLTLSDARQLLDATLAHDPQLIPYIAICMFAGVRPDECRQLRTAYIGTDYIRIPEDISKTHSARTVPIHQNLKAILAKYPIATDTVLNGIGADRFPKRLTALIKASGIEWANDILRHSYASYEYELTGNAERTAAQLGHTSTATMFKHYRGLVEPGTGRQYFAITI